MTTASSGGVDTSVAVDAVVVTARRAKCSVGQKFSQAQSLQVVSNITAAPLASATPLTTAATITASTACLAKPNRGGKSRNVTAHIVKQIRQYELGEETCCVPLSFLPPRYIKLIKLDYKSIALNGVRQAGRW
jgi:hypothetical protein